MYDEVLEVECKAISIAQVRSVLNVLPIGSVRCMFLMLFLTGCRISELDNMRVSLMRGNHIWWTLGKRQKGRRHKVLPEWFIKELILMRKGQDYHSDKLFSIGHAVFRRQFNVQTRPLLSKEWQEYQPCLKEGQLQREYALQLKGLRKTYATMKFFKIYRELQDAGAAVQFVSKDMQHSSQGLTSRHYIENRMILGRMDLSGQTKLIEYGSGWRTEKVVGIKKGLPLV